MYISSIRISFAHVYIFLIKKIVLINYENDLKLSLLNILQYGIEIF